MPTVYSGWRPNASTNRRMRLRLDYTVPTPAFGQSSVTVTGSVRVEAGYAFNDSTNTFTLSGTLGPSTSGSRNINVSTNGWQTLHTFSQTISLTGSTQTRTLTASLTGIEYVGINQTASVTANITIPARVIAAPNAPTGATLKRNADNSWEVSWGANPTVDRPITGFHIFRYRLSEGKTTLVTTAVGPSARKWTDKTSMPNDRVHYMVRAVNSAGGTNSNSTNYLFSTPAAPSNVVATRSGSTVNLSWKINARYAVHQDIQGQSSTDGGVTWSSWGSIGHSALPANSTTRAITGLDTSKLWRFRVQAVTAGPTLYAQSAPSNTLLLLQKPLPPTLLSPRSISDSRKPVRFEWRHNALDTTPQTAFELRYRPAGGAWVTVAGGSDSFWETDEPLDEGEWGWSVRTKGQHADFSNWPASAAFEVMPPPSVGIEPVDDPWPSNRLVVSVTASDPTGAAITTLRYRITNTNTAEVLEDSSLTFRSKVSPSAELADGESYSVEVWVTSSTGLTSESDMAWFTVDYLSPAPPRVMSSWLEEVGTVGLTVFDLPETWPVYLASPEEGPLWIPGAVYLGAGSWNLPPGFTVTSFDPVTEVTEITADSGAFASTDHLRIERSLDGGEKWTVFDDLLAEGAASEDWTVPLNSYVLYRAVAVSELGAETVSSVEEVFTESLNAFIRYGHGLGQSLRLDCDLDVGGALETHSIQHKLSNRRLPVSVYDLDHEAATTVAVSASFDRKRDLRSVEEELRMMLTSDVWWRDHERRAFMARVEGPSTSTTYGWASVSFTVHEVEGSPQ